MMIGVVLNRLLSMAKYNKYTCLTESTGMIGTSSNHERYVQTEDRCLYSSSHVRNLPAVSCIHQTPDNLSHHQRIFDLVKYCYDLLSVLCSI